jgi:diguanylate cyclase (GGDEF)-like protein/PAS domain S-box-containing protein
MDRGGPVCAEEANAVSKRRDEKKTQEQLIKELRKLRQSLMKLDQAESVRTQGAMQVSEQELLSIFDKIRHGIIGLDLTGKVVSINKKITEISGYTKKDVVGKQFNRLKMFPPKDMTTLLTAFAQVISGRTMSVEVKANAKAGEKLYVEIDGALLRIGRKTKRVIAFLRDVTARKQAEEALRESEEEWEAIFNEVRDGIVLLDLTGKIIKINQRIAEVTGYTEKYIVGKRFNFFKNFPASSIAKMIPAFGKVIAGQRVPPFEVIGYTKTGEKRIGEVYGSLLRERGKAVGALVVITDITDRKQTEEALRQSEEKYRTILANMEEGYYEVDLAGNLTFCNEAECRIHGRTRDEMIGLNNRQFSSPETARRIYAISNKVYKTGIPAKIVDYEIIRKDGSVAMIEMSISLLRNAAGEPIGFYGVSRDRTEQKKAEMALRENEQKYRDLVENINDIIYATDEHGIFTYIAPGIEAIGGYTTSELIGRPFFDFVFEEDIPYMREMFERDLSGHAEPHEYRAITKTGEIRWIHTSASPFFKEGRAIGLRGVSTDITTRKRAEEAVRESEEKYRTILSSMEEGYYEVDLAGNLTFFNNSLCRIYGYTRDELIEMNNRAYMSPETAKKTYQLFNKVYKTGEPSKIFDWEFMKKDGKTITVEISVSLMKDSQGNAVGFRGIVRDVTERKRAEEALRESEETLRALINAPTDSVLLLDSRGMILDLNEIAAERLGKNRDELIGTLAEDSLPVDIAKRRRATISQIFETRRPVRFEDERDGIWYDTAAHPIMDKDGMVRRVALIARDITGRMRAEQALRESEEKYRTILVNMEEGYYEVDLPGHITFCNDAVCRHHQRSREELLSMNNREYMTPEMAKNIYAIFNEVYRTGIPARFVDIEITRKDGTVALLEESVSLLRNATGKPIGFYGVSRDRTAQKQAEEALRQSEEKYRTIIENIEDGYYEVDLEGNFTFFNDAACRIHGYTRDELIGMNNQEYMDKETAKKVYKIFNTVLRTGKSATISNWQVTRKDGSQCDVESSVSLIRDMGGNPKGFRGIIRDITARKQAEEELQYRATHDALTGLPNRMLFNDRLSLARAQADRNKKKLAVMLLDLDYFKDVNDNMGHSTGDWLLREAGNRLKELLRGGDTVARVGGDEFLLLLSEMGSISDANSIAQKILEAFRIPFVLDDHKIVITTSIGIAIFPDDGDDADILVKHADVAMYRAKDKGRNNFQRYAPS